MENIQQRGANYKANGHGLLVYHVAYPSSTVNMTDSPNNKAGHPSVAVIPADGLLISGYLKGDGKEYTTSEYRSSLATPSPVLTTRRPSATRFHSPTSASTQKREP